MYIILGNHAEVYNIYKLFYRKTMIKMQKKNEIYIICVTSYLQNYYCILQNKLTHDNVCD